MNLQDEDVSRIPINIINNLVKIVKKDVFLVNVKGWKTTMFYNANCEWLGICYMMLNSVEDKRPMPIKVLVKVRPSLECDLQGLKDSLTFGPADQI